MTELEKLVLQLKAAIHECRENGYPKYQVKEILDLFEKIKEMLSEEQDKETLFGLARQFVNNAIEASKKREQNIDKFNTADTVQSADIGKLFPVTPNVDVKALTIYDISTIKSNAETAYGDNAIIICGPFASELLLQSYTYVKHIGRDMRVVDLSIMRGENSDAWFGIFNALIDYYSAVNRNEVIIYTNLASLKNDEAFAKTFCQFIRSMRKLCNRQNEVNFQQLLLLTDPSYFFNDVYINAVNDFAPEDKKADNFVDSLFDGASSKQLNYMYLRLPYYKTVRDYIRKQFSADVEDMQTTDFILKNCYLLGFEGLSYIVEHSSADNWREEVKTIKSQKEETFSQFSDRIGDGNIAIVLDSEWKYDAKSSHKITKVTHMTDEEIERLRNHTYVLPGTKYDYDKIDDLDSIKRSVQFILDSRTDIHGDEITVKQKCGLVLDYAMCNGDTLANNNNVASMDEEEIARNIEARWNIAYAALSQLMKVPYGKLVFDIPQDGSYYGLCCNGGEVIRMNSIFVTPEVLQDVVPVTKGKRAAQASASGRRNLLADGCKTMLHELFHALQHSADNAFRRLSVKQSNSGEYSKESIESDSYLLDYYFYHFGVTAARAREWSKNFNRYHQPETDHDVYEDQTVEADARIFGEEAFAEKDMVDLQQFSRD